MTEDNEDKNQDKGQPRRPGRTTRKDRPVADNPDVHLDALQLKVDELNLNLLNILNVEAKGLETELLLEVDLEDLVGLLRRVVDALDEDDEGVTGILEAVGRVIESVSGGSSGEGEESSAEQILNTLARTLGSSGGESSGDSPGGEADGRARDVRHTVDEDGEVTRTTLNGAGEVLEEEVLGNVSDLSGEQK